MDHAEIEAAFVACLISGPVEVPTDSALHDEAGLGDRCSKNRSGSVLSGLIGAGRVIRHREPLMCHGDDDRPIKFILLRQ